MGTTNILDLNNRLTKVEKEKVAQNSYTSLKNKPKINNVTLTGNKSLADIGAAAATDLTTLAGDVGDKTLLNTTDKSSTVAAINEVNGKIALDEWIPSNGFNPLTECDGWFCYSVNPDLLIYQGVPSGLSNYATVFGCTKSNYRLLVYIDIYGKIAVWSHQENQWVKYTNAN